MLLYIGITVGPLLGQLTPPYALMIGLRPLISVCGETAVTCGKTGDLFMIVIAGFKFGVDGPIIKDVDLGVFGKIVKAIDGHASIVLRWIGEKGCCGKSRKYIANTSMLKLKLVNIDIINFTIFATGGNNVTV